jgi:hypothetical protein
MTGNLRVNAQLKFPLVTWNLQHKLIDPVHVFLMTYDYKDDEYNERGQEALLGSNRSPSVFVNYLGQHLA